MHWLRKRFLIQSRPDGTAVNIKLLEPINEEDRQGRFFALPSKDIPVLAAKYFAAMESDESKYWCRCQWIVHPDDVGITKGQCAEEGCGKPASAPLHQLIPGATNTHHYRGIRMRKGDMAEDCPVHTREGMLIYFFEWVFNQ